MQRAEHEDFRDRVDLYSSLLAINAKITMDKDATPEQQTDHPYLMLNVYSVWLCNFDVDFCRSYREELGTFRFSDLGDKNALPVFPKKKYYYRHRQVCSGKGERLGTAVDGTIQADADGQADTREHRQGA